MANGSNKTTEIQMIAEMEALGEAYASGQDAWPMAFQKFESWAREGSITSAAGKVDKVKERVENFLSKAGKTTLAVTTVSTKIGEMRNAVKLGEWCAEKKVDGTKLISNVRAAMIASRKAGKTTMQTLNGFNHIAIRFVEKKADKLWTPEELQPMVKVNKKTTPAASVLDHWKTQARNLGLLTGIYTPDPKVKSEARTFTKTDTNEASVNVANAVIRYVNKLVATDNAAKAEAAAAKRTKAPVKAAAATRATPVKRGK